MKNVKDFDVREFAPESSATVMTVSGSDVRPNRRSLSTERSLSSEQSELTERNEVAGQTVPTPSSGRVEEIAPISLSGRDDKTRQTVSTSPNEQSALSHQTASAQTTEPPQPTPAPPSRVSSRQRRASLDEYREVFLHIPKIIDRQPVFVSRDVRDKIDGVVRRLGERKMSVSGFLENLARHHLNLYADNLEQWKRL